MLIQPHPWWLDAPVLPDCWFKLTDCLTLSRFLWLSNAIHQDPRCICSPLKWLPSWMDAWMTHNLLAFQRPIKTWQFSQAWATLISAPFFGMSLVDVWGLAIFVLLSLLCLSLVLLFPCLCYTIFILFLCFMNTQRLLELSSLPTE